MTKFNKEENKEALPTERSNVAKMHLLPVLALLPPGRQEPAVMHQVL
jgi:hypothetical protein